MKEKYYQIDHKICGFSQIVIDKWLSSMYTYDDHYLDTDGDTLDIVFWDGMDDHHTETFTMNVLNMTDDEFEVHLDDLKEIEWQKSIKRVQQKNYEAAKETALEEEREYQHYLELHEKYRDIDE